MAGEHGGSLPYGSCWWFEVVELPVAGYGERAVGLPGRAGQGFPAASGERVATWRCWCRVPAVAVVVGDRERGGRVPAAADGVGAERGGNSGVVWGDVAAGRSAVDGSLQRSAGQWPRREPIRGNGRTV